MPSSTSSAASVAVRGDEAAAAASPLPARGLRSCRTALPVPTPPCGLRMRTALLPAEVADDVCSDGGEDEEEPPLLDAVRTRTAMLPGGSAPGRADGGPSASAGDGLEDLAARPAAASEASAAGQQLLQPSLQAPCQRSRTAQLGPVHRSRTALLPLGEGCSGSRADLQADPPEAESAALLAVSLAQDCAEGRRRNSQLPTLLGRQDQQEVSAGSSIGGKQLEVTADGASRVISL